MADDDLLVEIFCGNQWEIAAIKSLLDDLKIDACVVDEHVGTLVPWQAAPGGLGAIRLMVREEDQEVGLQVVHDFLAHRD